VDFLGPHNLLTHFYDFDSTDSDRVLTRRMDFMRYLGVLSQPWLGLQNGLCFLKSPTPLIEMAMSRFQKVDFAAIRSSRLRTFQTRSWLAAARGQAKTAS
jgi:hypothetical protein